MKRSVVPITWFTVLFCLTSIRAADLEVISGRTMGTSFAIKLGSRSDTTSIEELTGLVKNELDRLESIFSLYKPDSELSRWNASSGDSWIEVSDDLFYVTQFAIELSQQTGGAFDPTVQPLIALWNLNQLSGNWKPPTPVSIQETKTRIGVDHIDMKSNPKALRKHSGAIQLDLNALVEGWAIERVLSLLRENGYRDVLFELGGEFGAVGKANQSLSWTIGIEDPTNPSRLISRVALSNESLCTSGSTRSVRVYEEKQYSHIVDPRTGSPVEHSLAAVSVLHANAMYGDGWATALMVLGPTHGPVIADQHGLLASFASVTPKGRQVQLSRKANGRFEQTNVEASTNGLFSRFHFAMVCVAFLVLAAIATAKYRSIQARILLPLKSMETNAIFSPSPHFGPREEKGRKNASQRCLKGARGAKTKR